MIAQIRKFTTSVRKRIRRRTWGARSRVAADGSVHTRQGVFVVDPDDEGVSAHLRRDGEYELDDLRRIERLLTPRSRVLVVGGHIGAYVVPLSKQCGTLTAVEANPRSFALLERNVALNDCANVRLLDVAAAEKEGEIEFVFNTRNSGGAKRMPKERDHAYFFDQPSVGTVRCARLDDALAGQSFDLILMDIEGSEYYALQGMPRLLSEAGTLIVEFLPHHLERVAGITVEQFLQPILPHFVELTIPSADRTVEANGMLAELESRFRRQRGDTGLIFRKR